MSSSQIALLQRILIVACILTPSLQAPLGESANDAAARHPSHPEYQYTYPSLVDSNGNHISYNLQQRVHYYKRDSASDGRTYFKIDAFDLTFILNVTTNHHFISSNAIVEYIGEDGSHQTQAPGQADCYHTGQLMNDDSGWVAVSNCGHGLHGVIATATDYYFIEPLKGSLGAVPAVTGWQHRVSRGTGQETGSCAYSEHHSLHTQHTPTKRAAATPSKRSVVTEHFIETTIVADRTMLEQHGRENLESYLFTLMNIVADLYRDPTIGQAVNIVLVRVIILETEQQGLTISSDPHTLLKSFCSWQREVNRERPHHDIAVLVTRKNICERTDCGTLGIAEIGGACDQSKSCNINEDIGLGTAFTIAHEMGHNLGMYHDGDPSVSCESDGQFLMSPSFSVSSNPHQWSHCSRQQLHDFLKSEANACLDLPAEDAVSVFSGSPVLPGMEYSRDEQCQMLYGPGATCCNGNTDECKWLWCSVEEGRCTHKHSPPASGTQCTLTSGEQGICYQGVCTEYSGVMVPVDGGWGEWGDWGECSMTCSMGIQSSERMCNSPTPANGGSYCLGAWKRYQTCNPQPCQEVKDYRQMLCEKEPPHDHYTAWEAPSLEYILGHSLDPCKHHCRATDNGIIYTKMKILPNGAPCMDPISHSPGVCLVGECVPVSCDHKLYTTSYKDDCGTWCGDGSTCISVYGTYSNLEASQEYTYYEVITLPKGSSNIQIEELQVTQHAYIAAQSSTYFLNGYFALTWPSLQSYWFAGATWWYERSHSHPEYLYTEDKIIEEVTVYLLSVKNGTGIHYSFAAPKDALEFSGQSLYYWNYTEWGVCEADGVQRRGVKCVSLSDGGNVSDGYCDLSHKPVDVLLCHNEPSQWNTGNWTKCDAFCGEGSQTRSVSCQKGGISEVVSDSYCEGLKPVDTRSCSVATCQWVVSEWTECDAFCGEGSQTRSVSCQRTSSKDGTSAIVSDGYCGSTLRPADSHSCHAGTCQWMVTEWTECDAFCGEGSQTRSVSCQRSSNNGSSEVVSDSNCDPSLKPVGTRSCSVAACDWVVSEWTECDAFCGEGSQTRSVSCQKDGSSEVVSDSYCEGLKPVDTRSCSVATCQWVVSEWTECDAFCGEGSQTRSVSCQRTSSKDGTSAIVSDGYCGSTLRPADSHSCHAGTCQWVVTEWTECDAFCGEGSQTRSVSCQRLSQNGSSEVVSDSNCDPSLKPVGTRSCSVAACDWVVSEWTECDAFCGEGSQTRSVSCQKNGSSEVVSDSYCEGLKPVDTRSCSVASCQWVVSGWTECDVFCGEGSQTRSVSCQRSGADGSLETVEDGHCHQTPKPTDTLSCQTSPCEWVTTEWTECDALCGEGTQSRTISCQKTGSSLLAPNDTHCSGLPKPTNTQSCQMESCDHFHWLFGGWTPCSVSCGVGTQFRNVICQHQNGTRMPEGYCMQEQQPGSIRTCNDECATSPPSCEDKKSYCHIVAKYNLCSLYMDVCCASCSAV